MKHTSSTMKWWIRTILIGITSILCLSLGVSNALASNVATSHGPTGQFIAPTHSGDGQPTDDILASELTIEPALTNPAETPILEAETEQISSLDWLGDVVATAPDSKSDSLDPLLDQWRSIMQALFADR